jgi:hypothetical protein
MKRAVLFLGVFFTTLLIGYLIVPKMTQNIEPQEITSITEKEETVFSKTIQTQEIIEEISEIDLENKEDFSVKLLETGEGFHGEQVNAKSGETWLGLFKKDDKYVLEKTKIEIEKVYDTVVDGKNKKVETGKTVKTSNKNPSIFLLKNADFLKQGEIETLFGGNHLGNEIKENIDYLSLKIGFSKDFVIDNEKFTLKVKKGINQKNKQIIALVLENKGISQTLHSLNYFGEDDYLGTLYWAGDLDKDNKPDFYLNLYFHDNLEDKYLFLSSKAVNGKLVKKVANFWINGC